MWIDAGMMAVGDVGFLVSRRSGGSERYWLRESPARTNQSHEPRLTGWCGETDNVSVTAEGMARVVRVTANGERALVQRLTGPEMVAALESLGYPDLAD